MQYISSAIYFSILVMMVITPFAMPFLLRRKGYVTSLLLSSFLSFMTCVLLVTLLAYLPDLYAEMRLDYLGFDFNGWSDEDRLRNIAPEFRDEAIKLYRSIMGIGWILKAIAGAVLLIPYQIVASGLVFMVSQSKKHGS
ncbi:hypothetical protein VF14_15895 [Nostoc linckia z18]|uniref:Uncharacterized protein n=3 Tax=Nostoc linckia TaxID=92942 RepID=A0A9Q5ZDD7_NOSLI|nr:hypothetical protein [Nostoc linckia]PHJ64665.1 hypothetical protein VF05_22245 [Nostoc linckia z3]PHJ71519.1 hypothetical protein VF03_19880 [Nostoc linckia z2]PHJ80224.1 hypothetical protein VF06_23285 [Nostoc linckia z4]PHJ85978.1 hypothetical protein VF07_22540 [Nostoc linckia z6]PHJ97399.1 hypothetical protein VF04_12605 [Nostoc linckia z7]PHK04582.1 hypothetical protein VF08_10845 [Nostoc linckia z8]PHK11775.1 hypothetical protein VF09_06245 [Nostoc linckia z9]PHK20238.1 hypothetic